MLLLFLNEIPFRKKLTLPSRRYHRSNDDQDDPRYGNPGAFAG